MNWRNMSPISALIYAVSAVNIIPRLQSKLTDGISLAVMMIMVTVPGFCIAYFDIEDTLLIAKENSMNQFSYIVLDTVGPLQIILLHPCLAYLIYRYKPIVLGYNLPKPKYIGHLTLVLVLSLVPGTVFLYIYLRYYKSWFMITSVVFFVFLQLCTRLLTLLIIGSVLEHLSRRIDAILDSHCTLLLIEDLSADYESIKKGLSPLLFTIFTTQTLLTGMDSAR